MAQKHFSVPCAINTTKPSNAMPFRDTHWQSLLQPRPKTRHSDTSATQTALLYDKSTNTEINSTSIHFLHALGVSVVKFF